MKIGIIGLGYVGVQLAVAFGQKIDTVGFDLDQHKIEAYKWFFISGELGNANGGKNRQIVGKSMHSGDVSKAGKLARA